jgi:methionyl-tRNA synthetase
MLMAAGFPLPKQIYGHGWLVTDGDKMSKSKGNVVDPVALVEEFGADAIRYFLLREITLGLDGNFSRDALIQRINADLANDLGNLLHRTLNMIGKFQKKILLPATDGTDLDKSFCAEAVDTAREYRKLMENIQLSDAVKVVWKFIGRANKYIDETMPWKLVKDETQRQELANVLYNLAESLRIIGILISPFMPATAQKICEQLNVSQELKLDDAETFGLLAANHEVGKPQQLFPRILLEKE